LIETRRRAAAWTSGGLWLLAVLQIGAIVVLLVTSRGGIDRSGYLIGTDFLGFWTSGRMLQTGANPYDVAAHTAAQRTFLFRPGVHTAFFYPPPFLPVCWPLGLFGYFPALALWLTATGAAYVTAARAWLRRMDIARPVLLLFAGFPPVLLLIEHGQTTFLVAALLGFGLLLVPERPWLAGVLLGLAVIKPQLGLLVPVALLLTREWPTITAATASAALLCLLSTLAFGPQIWPDWLHVSQVAQTTMERGLVPHAKMQSPFAAAMLLGAPPRLAYAVQTATTLAVAAAVAWTSWRRGNERGFDLPLAALVLAGAPLATPFLLDYDLVLLAFPLIWLAAQPTRPWEKAVMLATFAAPAISRELALSLGVPIMPAVLMAFFAVMWRRVDENARAGRVDRGAGPVPVLRRR
jgi:hypothetical protein